MSQRYLFRSARQAFWASLCLVLLSLWLGGPSSTIQADDPSFAARRAFGTGRDHTASVVVGDMDGDGDLDIVVGNQLSRYEGNSWNAVYLNDGAGNFLVGRDFGTGGDNTFSMAVGDMDGDGDLDIAIGNTLGEQNVVYLNDGAGNFPVGRDFGTGLDDTRSVAVGDMDGDSDLDIVVGNDGQQNVVYLNDGTGNFPVGQDFGTGGDATESVAVGDMDGNGDLDIVVGNYRSEQNVVYLNDGAGSFSIVRDFGTGSDITLSVAAGDMDSDGDLDIVTGNTGQNVVYLNDGAGNFPTGQGFGTGSNATFSVAAGDMDGDGDLDIVTGNMWGEEQDVVYLNDGGANFATGQDFGTGSDDTASVAVGDMDSDGHLDIIVGNTGRQNVVYLNDGAGSLLVGRNFGTTEDSSGCVAVGDMDGDGDLDIVASNAGQNYVYLNDGMGNLTIGQGFGTGSDATSSVAVGDMDGDSDLDIVVGNVGQNFVHLNDGMGNFTVGRSFGTGSDDTISLAVGDMDGDGDLDIIIGNEPGPFPLGSFRNVVYLNDGAGNFLVGRDFGSRKDYTRGVAVGDMDGDGDLDIVVGNTFIQFGDPLGDQNIVYLNDGAGNFPVERNFGTGLDDTRSVAVGDMDGDGDLDIVVGNYRGEQNVIYLNDGAGNFPVGQGFGTGGDATESVAVGDMDGDGDLDIVVGNYRGEQNVVYLNDGAGDFAVERDFGIGSDDTLCVAVGDVDGDGDLDIAIGNRSYREAKDYRNAVYLNGLDGSAGLVNNPPHVALTRPGPTQAAGFYSTPAILSTPTIPITYTLFDPENDPVRYIRAFFSPSGGGQWFPATPAAGTITTTLAASPWPTGTMHTFTWDAEADLIRSDNVVFRIEAYQGFTGPGPYQRPYFSAQAFPFRVEATEWYAKVIDESGTPIEGATVYSNGHLVTDGDGAPRLTDRAGFVKLDSLGVGDTLVALSSPQYEQPSSRAAHAGWAYRTYLTSLTWDVNGQLQPFVVSESGEQRLVVRRDHPLVLFNLVVSIEWGATDEYLDQIARAVRYASDYLYDLTDGQMAFGQVGIYDNAQHWADADIQVSTKNIVHPHAFIGGITSDDTSHVIRLGRYWDGNSGNQGAWDQPAGFRTLAHEFGHYALYLYDEYFGYTFDGNGNLTGEIPAYCTMPKELLPEGDAASASAMYYQYKTSELSARDVPGLWSDLCEATAQWQLTERQLGQGESAWETLSRMYADQASPPRWQFTTPADQGSVMDGPVALPSNILPLPAVTVHDSGTSGPPRELTVYGPQRPYWGAIVALYKQDGRVIGQGFTDSDGRLDVYGAVEGDILRAASFDGGLAGSVTVGTETSLTLHLQPVRGLAVQTAGGTSQKIPHMRVVAEPSQDPNQIDLLVFLHNFGPGADPSVIVTEPGSEVGHAPTLSYSPATGTYKGQLSFSATERGMGRIRAMGAIGNSLMRLQSTYRLQHVINDQGHDVYSDDGNLSLHLEPGSLPGNDAYSVVMPPGAVPGPLPAGRMLVGDPYDVTASGALVALERPAVLKLRYDEVLVSRSSAPPGLGIYWWDPESGRWRAVPGNLDEKQKAVVASVTTLSTYALMVQAGPPPSVTFLPIILKDAR